MYSAELKQGNTYEKAKKTVCILIADFEIQELENIEKYITRWNLREEDFPKKILTDVMDIYIIELPKVEKYGSSMIYIRKGDNKMENENLYKNNNIKQENEAQDDVTPKEINQIYNKKVKMYLANHSIELLLNQQIITEEDVKFAKVEFGYIFTKIDNVYEALFKITIKEKNYYFAVQNNKILFVNINEERYIETIKYMTNEHECLQKVEINETELQKRRRLKNFEYLNNHGIVASPDMLCIYDDENVKLKDLDLICKKAYLNEKERRIINGTYTNQDVIDMDWEYETYWAICWCLGLVDDIKDAGGCCDCNKAISLVINSSSVEDFKSRCKMRSISEILDMQDLYYRFNWAINEKKINNEVSIGNLDSSTVLERARGLEWIISNEFDWYKISVNG